MILDIVAILYGWVLLTHIIGGRAHGRQDSTDPAKGNSGLRILVDHKTGLQYLTTLAGGLTPRMHTNCQQMTVEDDR